MHNVYRPHERVVKTFTQPSSTVQSETDACNVNLIMARYLKTGVLDHQNEHAAQYGEMPDLDDYHSAMNIVAASDQIFAELPAELRKEFNNDTAAYLDFVTNAENEDAMIEMGLLPPKRPVQGDNDNDVPVVEPDVEAPVAPSEAPTGAD